MRGIRVYPGGKWYLGVSRRMSPAFAVGTDEWDGVTRLYFRLYVLHIPLTA